MRGNYCIDEETVGARDFLACQTSQKLVSEGVWLRPMNVAVAWTTGQSAKSGHGSDPLVVTLTDMLFNKYSS